MYFLVMYADSTAVALSNIIYANNIRFQESGYRRDLLGLQVIPGEFQDFGTSLLLVVRHSLRFRRM